MDLPEGKQEWMFDPVSGSLLAFTPEGAFCPETNYKEDLSSELKICRAAGVLAVENRIRRSENSAQV